MDDFVVNVRQIFQYPQTPPQASDFVLLQRGFGGQYISSTVADLINAILATGAQIFASHFVLPENGALGWDTAGQLSFSQATGFTFAYAGPSPLFSALLHLRPDGSAQLPFNTLTVARDPFEPFEVVTKNFWENNTVASFNGRIGAVCLSNDDLADTLGGQPATQEWVNALLCASIPDFIYRNPFVYTFNGRVGDITLTIDDVEQAFFAQPGVYPTAPSPPLGDASKRIATTGFVDESLEEWAETINSSWNAADFELLNILQTQYAPLNSPAFTGTPTAPTPAVNSRDASIATTAYVMNAITSSVTGVISFNTRTGAVVFTAADLNSVGGAPLASPTFTGTPTAPLPPASDNSNKIATTAWVLSELSAISAGVTSFNGRSGIVLFQGSDLTAVGGAMLASPTFTGIPAAPTASPGTSTTQIATTAFVMANAGVSSFNSRTGAITLQSNDISAANGALLAGPAFTGVPTAPTAVPGTNTTQIATTAFVVAQLAGANVVTSFNTRTGAIVFTAADLASVNGATLSQGTAPPASPSTSSLWWDTTNGNLYVYFGGAWVAAMA